MFRQNKYSEWYFSLVERAKTRTLDTYSENHHIIPKSLGGSNSKDNLVSLTPKEHYVCHRLLVKMTHGEAKAKMLCAALIMMHGIDLNRTYRINSTSYQSIKMQRAQALSNLKKGKPGIPRSAETREKMRASKLGIKKSPECKEKMRLAALGRKHSQETKEKFKVRVSNRLGTKHSDETKQKMRLAKQKNLAVL